MRAVKTLRLGLLLGGAWLAAWPALAAAGTGFEAASGAVVVPAHNEAKKISEVISSMPSFVDLIILVDDASSDQTVKIAQTAAKKYRQKIETIILKNNTGVGGAIVEGGAGGTRVE